MMSHFAALYSIVFMIGFVCVFDIRHSRHRFCRLFASTSLMTAEELDQVRMIWSACEDA